ncbi:MAG TPA: aminotransferase class III-fold pyridoxal phosphate-dependent enzyme [Actinomycetota bacterium]
MGSSTTAGAQTDVEQAVMPTYARYPVTLVRGAGTRVWDEDGGEYLDFAGSLGVTAIGHSHPTWVRAVKEQLDELDMVSNLYNTRPHAALASKLASLLPIPHAQVFFANSGAEANEAAIKLARKHGLAAGRPTIVSLEGSFHGRTVGALAATGQPSKRSMFEPLVDWFRFVPAGDVAALDASLTPDVAALLLEPVMGEGGIHPLDGAYLRAARTLCDERGVLLVADEVQSGMGRCGDWLAISDSGVVPDLVTLAKALGGGLPIGALVAPASLAFGPGEHATTFGGGPVVCAGSLAVLDVIEQEGLLGRARSIGALLPEAVMAEVPPGTIVEARGRGCLWGFELWAPVADEVVRAMLDEGVLASVAGADVVRYSPPLIATDEDIEMAATALGVAIDRVVGAGAADGGGAPR